MRSRQRRRLATSDGRQRTEATRCGLAALEEGEQGGGGCRGAPSPLLARTPGPFPH
jgi:hypothetical protein